MFDHVVVAATYPDFRHNHGDRDTFGLHVLGRLLPCNRLHAFKQMIPLNNASSATGTLDAQVYFEPYHPGMTYVSTGRSCGVVMSHETAVRRITKVCTDVGPQTATL